MAAAAITLAATRAAHAESPPLRLDYRAHVGCPDAVVLIDEIASRTPRARFATPSESALTVEARITRRGGESRGHLVIGAGRDRVVRDIASASCDEIVSAFALITALAIDPNASTTPLAPAPPAPPTPPPPPAPVPPLRPPRAGPTLPTADVFALPLPVWPAPLPERAVPPPGFWILGARGGAALAVAPRPLVGGGLFVERAFDAEARASLTLAAELAATGDFTVGPAGAAFWQAALRVDGCAFGRRFLARFGLVPCARAEGGAVGGAGIPGGALTQVQKAVVPWFGIGFAPRISVDLARVIVELQGGPTFPLVRRSFRFDSPDYVIHDVPPVVWSVGLGAGVRFP